MHLIKSNKYREQNITVSYKEGLKSIFKAEIKCFVFNRLASFFIKSLPLLEYISIKQGSKKLSFPSSKPSNLYYLLHTFLSFPYILFQTISFLSPLSLFLFHFLPLPHLFPSFSLSFCFTFLFSLSIPGKFENFSCLPGSTTTTLLHFLSPAIKHDLK